MGMGLKFQMVMGIRIKSLKWKGIGTKNLLPHISSLNAALFSIIQRCVYVLCMCGRAQKRLLQKVLLRLTRDLFDLLRRPR